MKANEIVTWLNKFGVVGETIPVKTLKRWALEGIIAKPSPAKLKGPGQAANWPEEALEEAAAVWAVRHNDAGVRVTTEMIEVIKDQVTNVLSTGFAIYKIPPVMRSLDWFREVEPTEIELQFAREAIPRPDGSDAVLLFPGNSTKERVELLDSLIVKWIATVAKIQFTRWQHEVALENGMKPRYRWPTTGAVVVVHYRCTPIQAAGKDRSPSLGRRRCWFEGLTIGGTADRDRIFLTENGIETRILLARGVRFAAI
jgi:hypothetical protein